MAFPDTPFLLGWGLFSGAMEWIVSFREWIFPWFSVEGMCVFWKIQMFGMKMLEKMMCFLLKYIYIYIYIYMVPFLGTWHVRFQGGVRWVFAETWMLLDEWMKSFWGYLGVATITISRFIWGDHFILLELCAFFKLHYLIIGAFPPFQCQMKVYWNSPKNVHILVMTLTWKGGSPKKKKLSVVCVKFWIVFCPNKIQQNEGWYSGPFWKVECRQKKTVIRENGLPMARLLRTLDFGIPTSLGTPSSQVQNIIWPISYWGTGNPPERIDCIYQCTKKRTKKFAVDLGVFFTPQMFEAEKISWCFFKLQRKRRRFPYTGAWRNSLRPPTMWDPSVCLRDCNLEHGTLSKTINKQPCMRYCA